MDGQSNGKSPRCSSSSSRWRECDSVENIGNTNENLLVHKFDPGRRSHTAAGVKESCFPIASTYESGKNSMSFGGMICLINVIYTIWGYLQI